jgi:hypothetical protein
MHLCRDVGANQARPGSEVLKEKLSQAAGVAFHYGFRQVLADVVLMPARVDLTVLVHIALHIHAQDFAIIAE